MCGLLDEYTGYILYSRYPFLLHVPTSNLGFLFFCLDLFYQLIVILPLTPFTYVLSMEDIYPPLAFLRLFFFPCHIPSSGVLVEGRR